ncbi:PREDICTED: pickpocket protein 28-like [Nicrophorus vespilloides]|uniref:Pickpocket protein 28-like n=1 Tax=Nicrophorus vespilloides TaxID=110193 RepID=A0ABM1M747_NICVS|nr:PREDICTED: pickpocket protein 28-like [Nicrophorus vespilloides]
MLSQKHRNQMNNYFTEYCNATSIHGFRYLGEQKRSYTEKIWWLVTLIASVCLCTYLIMKTYNKWERSPVIVSFATKQTPIWQIPFPAVTICPETKCLQSEFNFTKLYLKTLNGTLNDDELATLEYLSLICNPRMAISLLKMKTINETILHFFDDISPNYEDVFLICFWIGEPFYCKSIFTPILTDEGVCFTFNMLDRKELFNDDMLIFKDYLQHNQSSVGWNLEYGYGKNVKKNTYPRRALFSGATKGLQVIMLANDKDLDYICGDSLQGYKILLHHPAEVPRVSQQYFRVPLNQAVVAGIKPEVMTTSSELQSYPPEKRQCYFPNERNLRFFKIYTQQNCEVECLANFTLRLCKCVDFHMPHAKFTPICGARKLGCMKYADSMLLSNEIETKLREIEDEELQKNESFMDSLDSVFDKFVNKDKNEEKPRSSKCDCLPSCTSLSYSIETSQADWNWAEYFRGLNETILADKDKVYLSKLVIFFKDMQFISSERDELYGPIDFLANCGGLLGLFMGFSFISLVEIIYFLSLRLINNIRKRRIHKVIEFDA